MYTLTLFQFHSAITTLALRVKKSYALKKIGHTCMHEEWSHSTAKKPVA